MSENSTYPTEYRSNTIYDEKKVSELDSEEYPTLTLVTDQYEINRILEYIGVDHDPESIIAEDSYGCLWVETDNGEYSEVWGIHRSVPYMDYWAVRLR